MSRPRRASPQDHKITKTTNSFVVFAFLVSFVMAAVGRSAAVVVALQPMSKRLKLTVRAHAKVNLDLRVLGVRADGYHELRTVFQVIELHDTLVCTEKPGPFTLKCRNPGVPLDGSNLVWKAAAALWTALGRSGDICDAVIQIDKKIPVEAGLGGGSADAAAALMALGRLWGRRADQPPA